MVVSRRARPTTVRPTRWLDAPSATWIPMSLHFWFNYPWRILTTDGKRFSGNLICEGETHELEIT